jgi:hypothetical protein
VIYRISDRTWERLCARAAQLNLLSAQATNTRPWNPDFNLIGLIGESLYEAITGWPMQNGDELGDGGCDFPGVDVKCTPHFDDPLAASVYFLAAVNLPTREARPVGYATRSMLMEAPLVEYGHGPTRTLQERELLSADALIPRLFCE